jgi:hypothetical protein
MVQELRELVKRADKIQIAEVKGKKATLKISWFNVKGAKISLIFACRKRQDRILRF